VKITPHVQEDRSECHNLAKEHPELLKELIAWYSAHSSSAKWDQSEGV